MSTESERGYTLVELAIAMGVFLVFMSFTTPFLFSHLRTAVQTENRTDLQQNARVALRTLERELRQARELYATTNRPSGKNKLSFGVDLDGDGIVAPSERITYYVKQNKLYKGPEDDKGQPVADDIAGIDFTFYGSNPALDANGDGVVTEAEMGLTSSGVWSQSALNHVTRIDVVLTARRGGIEQSHEARVWLRNRTVG